MSSVRSHLLSLPTLIFSILLLVLLCTGCLAEAEVSNQRRIFVGPKLVDCVGEASQKCMLVKNKPEDDWSLYYSQIEGFDYEEGYEYELIVELKAFDNPPQDGPMVRTRLVEVVSKAEEINPVSGINKVTQGLPLLSWDTLQNSTYPIPISPGGIAWLESGQYQEILPASLGSSLEVRLLPYRYYGELDGDSLEDTVVFLLIQQGNQPASTYLVGVLNQAETARPLPPQELGSGVFIRGAVIEEGKVFLDLDYIGETSPVCCPIESKRLVFDLVDDNLQKVEEMELVDSKSPVPPDNINPIINMKPGGDDKVIVGVLEPHLIQVHPVHGLAGQILEVEVDTLHNDVLLSIVGLEDDAVLLSAGAGLSRWSGEMPSTQDYAIKVIPLGEKTDYTLRASINASGGRTLLIPPEPYLVPSDDNTVDVYSGPGMGFKLIGMLGVGEAIHIKGKNQGVTPETKWWQVCCFAGQDGWVRDDFVEVVGSTGELPVPGNGNLGTPVPVEPEQPPSAKSENKVYLTFDLSTDEIQITEEILKELVKYDAVGTFFLDSEINSRNSDLIQKILASGSNVAPLLSNRFGTQIYSPQDMAEEYQEAWELLKINAEKCLRLDLTHSDALSRALASEMGFKVMPWSVDAQDWKVNDADEIADRVIEQIAPNVVVVMQGSGTELKTVQALGEILKFLSEHEYRFGLLCPK